MTGTEALVGLVDNPGDRRVLAYVCDGKTVGMWFTGEAAPDGTVDLTSPDGARLRGESPATRWRGRSLWPMTGPSTPSRRRPSPRPPACTAPAARWPVNPR